MNHQKPDLHNINAQIKFGENSFRFTQVIVLKLNQNEMMITVSVN